jgi:phosphoglucomutase
MSIKTITTQPFSGQVSGTSGLRKKVTVFKQIAARTGIGKPTVAT